MQDLDQLIRIPRLRDVAIQADVVDGIDDRPDIGIAGEHDADRFGMLRLDAVHQLDPRHLRHPLVGHDHVNRVLLEDFQRLAAALGGVQLELAPQQALQRVEDLRLVIHQQDRMLLRLAHRFGSCVG